MTFRYGDVHLLLYSTEESKRECVQTLLNKIGPMCNDSNVKIDQNIQRIEARVCALQSCMQKHILLQNRSAINRALFHNVIVIDASMNVIHSDIMQSAFMKQKDHIDSFIASRTRSQGIVNETVADVDEDVYSRVERMFELARRYAITFIFPISMKSAVWCDQTFDVNWFDYISFPSVSRQVVSAHLQLWYEPKQSSSHDNELCIVRYGHGFQNPVQI